MKSSGWQQYMINPQNLIRRTKKITIMEQGLSLRDKLAMSLKDDLIPELPNQDAIDNVAKYLDIEFDETDFVKMIEFGFAYQSKVRYMYADAMLKEREK